MINVKVISMFKDKDTKELYKVDKELTVSKARYKEIKDYVKVIDNSKKENQNKAED